MLIIETMLFILITFVDIESILGITIKERIITGIVIIIAIIQIIKIIKKLSYYINFHLSKLNRFVL